MLASLDVDEFGCWRVCTWASLGRGRVWAWASLDVG